MNVMVTAFKKFQGKVKKVNKKEVLEGENFWTPPCLVSLIPEGTIYYEIILEQGALKETLSLPDREILKSTVKLTFFERPWGRMFESKDRILEKEIVVGKDYLFNTQSWSKGYWVSSWKKLTMNKNNPFKNVSF